MSYNPITEEQQTLDIGDDDGELDVVVKRKEKPSKPQMQLIFWIVLVTIVGGVIIYLGYSNSHVGSGNTRKNNKPSNYTKINKTSTTCLFIKAFYENETKLKDVNEDEPKLVSLNETKRKDDIELKEEVNEDNNEEEIKQQDDEIESPEEEANVDFEEMQIKSDKLKQDIKNYYEHKNSTSANATDKRYDKTLCDQGLYMESSEKKCKKCEDRCDECMHISGICYKCQNEVQFSKYQEYYLNQYGKCIPKCEGYHDSSNLLLSDENKNLSIPICLGKHIQSSIYMTVQKSNNTHFVLPYIIIHPATTVTLLYHNNYPIVYYFNKDLFNFEEELRLTDIAQQAQERQQIVAVIGCHTLYDFSLFNNFLFQEAVQNIECLVKARTSTFRAFFGQDYNAYGVIREYQAQYKNNTIDLVISDDPKEIAHEQLEQNLLVTHEQHYTDYNFESLQGAQSQKTTVILLFHTKNENDTHDYCQKFKYVSFLQCAVREIQIDHIQRMKQGLELISQFVVQPDL